MNAAVLEQLDAVCRDRGSPLARPLASVLSSIDGDMLAIDEELARVDAPSPAPAESSVRHLLAQRGKRLRPMCVALAARTGPLGFTAAARNLAVAAELVHAATLLHDDVVDLGSLRRGVPTARVIYGNAASIFGGDWLLVEAMRRIQEADVPGALQEALGVLRVMVEAESLQLAARGSDNATLEHNRARYLHIAEGKTASLFAWALSTGARSGGATDAAARALGTFGRQLGLAFQIVDDVLDLDDTAAIGKNALADIREGKMTFPIVLALEHDPRIATWLAEAERATQVDDALLQRIAEAVRATGAVAASRECAHELTDSALAALDQVPSCNARDALARAAADLVGRRA